MITLLTGENSFEIDRELRRIVEGFDGSAEKIDGSEIELRQLPDLLMGVSLFSEKRLVVIKNLSENSSVWIDFADWLDRVSDDIHVVLVDQKPDKRTRTYKELQKLAKVNEFKPWGERDQAVAEKWTLEEAERLGLKLDRGLVRQVIERTGFDQWRVYHALQKLAVLDTVTSDTIADIVELSPTENIFQLFETALKGETDKLHAMIQTLQVTEDAYKVFGLLNGQVFQLATLAVTNKPYGEVAKDIAAHPFVLSKLSSYAKKRGKRGASKIIAIFDDTDQRMKTSTADGWTLIERALMKIAISS